MFADEGYSNVGIEDIGTAVGIAGPSVYKHFETKADILIAAMMRGGEWLRVDLIRTLTHAASNADGLRRLLKSYCDLVLEQPALVYLVLTQTVELPIEEQHRSARHSTSTSSSGRVSCADSSGLGRDECAYPRPGRHRHGQRHHADSSRPPLPQPARSASLPRGAHSPIRTRGAHHMMARTTRIRRLNRSVHHRVARVPH